MNKPVFSVVILFFLAFNSFAQDFQWAKAIKTYGSGQVIYNSIAADEHGNVLGVGFFSNSSIEFDTHILNNLTGNSNRNAFIVKYNSMGAVAWAQSAQSMVYNKVGLDNIGNAFVLGCVQDSSTIFVGQDSINFIDGETLLAKYDTMGNIVWAKPLSTNVCALGNSFNCTGTIDENGNILILGRDSLRNFMAKYNSNGNLLWDRLFNRQGICDIAIDRIGNIYMTGYFGDNNGSITLDSITLFATPSLQYGVYAYDAYVAKYNPSGNIVWAKSFGGFANEIGYCVSVDSLSNLYVSGAFGSPIVCIGSVVLVNKGSINMFILKYDTNGNLLWGRTSGGNGWDWGANDITTDKNNNIIAAGLFSSYNFILDTHTSLINTHGTYNSSAAADDILIIKYDSSGNIVWGESIANHSHAYHEEATNIATNLNDEIFIAGFFTGDSLTIGNTVLEKTNVYDATHFITKFIISPFSGIEKNNNKLIINIFPNPTESVVYLDNPNNEKIKIILLDNQGKPLMAKNVESLVYQIDMTTYPTGIYMLFVSNGKSNDIYRIVKK